MLKKSLKEWKELWKEDESFRKCVTITGGLVSAIFIKKYISRGKTINVLKVNNAILKGQIKDAVTINDNYVVILNTQKKLIDHITDKK